VQVNWTREDFQEDRQRYQRALDDLLSKGLTDGHPLIERQRRRLRTADRVLTDPAYGMTAVPVPHPTCIDVTGTDQEPRSEWACGPECPKEA
jgi:hypothetical protein